MAKIDLKHKRDFKMKKTPVVIAFYLILFLKFAIGCQPNDVGNSENNPPMAMTATSFSEGVTATRQEPIATATLLPSPTITLTAITMSANVPATIETSTGELHIVSEPEGAMATIASEGLSAQTPVAWTIMPGTYTVTFTLDGYEDWITQITVIENSKTRITASLHKQYVIIPIEENAGLFDVQWSEDGQSLIYALGDEQWPSHVQFLPVYQTWWRYDITTGNKIALPPLQTRVTNPVRELLGICPFPLSESVPPPYPCNHTLQESPTSNRIVFSAGVNVSVEANTWLANIDGSDVVYLDNFPGYPEDVKWSSTDQWLLVGYYNGISKTYYLVSSDGTFVESLEGLTNTSHWRVFGPTPQFSPDGQKVAFVGIEIGSGQFTEEQESQEDAYNLYVLDLNTLEYQLVSSRFGLFQWARDGSGLYVLDGSASTSGSITTVREVRYTDLYYIDLTQESYHEEKLATSISMYPRYTSAWAYSPEANAMAGKFDIQKSIFSVMLLE